MNFSIETNLTPGDADYQAILAPLRAYNEASAGLRGIEKVALLVKDDAGEVVGGLHARIGGQWMFVELLVIPEAARGQGMGTRLMEQAEALARDKQCIGLWLDTFSFQAPEFYRRLGFSVFGELRDFPPGHSRFFMQKRFEG